MLAKWRRSRRTWVAPRRREVRLVGQSTAQVSPLLLSITQYVVPDCFLRASLVGVHPTDNNTTARELKRTYRAQLSSSLWSALHPDRVAEIGLAHERQLIRELEQHPTRGSVTTRRAPRGMVAWLDAARTAYRSVHLENTSNRAYNMAVSPTEVLSNRTRMSMCSGVPCQPQRGADPLKRSAASASWYARQAAERVLTPSDLTGLHDQQRQQSASSDHRSLRERELELSVSVFLGCAASARSQQWDLKSLFRGLQPEAQARVIELTLAESSSKADKSHSDVATLSSLRPVRAPMPLPVSDMVAIFSHAVQGEISGDKSRVSALVQVVTALTSVVALRRVPPEGLLAVFTAALALSPDIVNVTANPHTLSRRILASAEHAQLHHHTHTRSVWCASLARSPHPALAFEALAYLSEEVAGRPALVEPSRAVAAGLGYGNDVVALLDACTRGATVSEVSRSLKRLCEVEAMPSVLRRYATDLCVMALSRRGQERPVTNSRSNEDSEGHELLLPFSLVESRMTELQFASHIHFTLRCGNRHTADLLLPHSRTRQQVVATMQHTRHAGIASAFAGARRLLAVRPSEKMYVAVRFGDGSLAFEVLAERAERRHSQGQVTAWGELSKYEGGVDDCVMKPDPLSLHQSKALRCAVQLAAPEVSFSGPRSLEVALATLSRGAVTVVVTALGVHFTASLASWWTAALLRAGRIDAAVTVLRATRSRDLLPDMAVLVALLEASTGSATELRAVLAYLEEDYASVCATVARAFVERAATQARSTPEAALEFLSTVAMLGLRRFPMRCVEKIALNAPTPLLCTMLELMRQRGAQEPVSVSRASSALLADLPALHVDAVERLAEAAAKLGLSPDVDIYAISPGARHAAWWSSEAWSVPPMPSTVSGEPCRAAQSVDKLVPASARLYRTATYELWPIAAQELTWLHTSTRGLHNGLRVLSLACPDGPRVVEAFRNVRRQLLPSQQKSQRARWQRSRVRSQLRCEWALMCTVAFMVEALSRRGLWQCALELLPGEVLRPSNSEAAPGRTAPEALAALPPLLRVVRLRAMRRSPEFANFGAISSDAEERAMLQHAWDAHQTARRRAYRHQPHLRRRRHAVAKRTGEKLAGDAGALAAARQMLPFPIALKQLLWPIRGR